MSQTISQESPTNEQIQRFNKVRCILANLYHECILHRKHLKTKEGYQLATQEAYEEEELNSIQFWLIALIIKFLETEWQSIDLVKTPKLPDIYLLQLQQHTLFEGRPIEEFTKSVALSAKEKKTIKELSLRLS